MAFFKHANRNQKGFTLIEILITVIVLSIGLLGLAGLQISGLRANLSSEARSKASILANDIAERMRTNPLGVQNEDPGADNLYADISTADQNCDNLPEKFCSNYNDGQPHTADSCTPAEMATFDTWVWACGMPKAENVVPEGVTNILSEGTGTVTCNDDNLADADACSPGSSHTITISWNELSPNRSAEVTEGEVLTQNYTLVVVP